MCAGIGGTMSAMSELPRPGSSPLTGSTRKRRRLLTVTDGSGTTVVEAKVGKEAKPAGGLLECPARPGPR